VSHLTERDVEMNLASDLKAVEPPEETAQEVHEQPAFEPETRRKLEVELKSEAEAVPEALQVQV
jgi:hypothetical protein